ncbi:hypothetical protein L914_15445 [Phytophthora nicotianae]|uniref:Uncharacterized protein n=2 Tax=Phytophthora nicotianae TaxID=4792 RepID=V9EGQ1_PHYNI|nr:hypothetical protein F443_16038 [Phytophthora nicotianae P1569]ETM38184.1 hypothetical protein L914_15445 [Phytophthora nicotianae]
MYEKEQLDHREHSGSEHLVLLSEGVSHHGSAMLEDRIRSEAFYEMALQPWPFQLDTTLNFVRGGVQEAGKAIVA